jgi:ankyrin repeat protein
VLWLAGVAAAADRNPLVEAAKARDVAAVRALLEHDVDVNAPAPDGVTALHWAADRGDAELLDLLLRAGARVNAQSDSGATPLWLASTNGHADAVIRLLAAGADPNVALRFGETPLMAAANIGHRIIVESLVAAGADVNTTESRTGQTALMWAAAEGHVDVAKVLLERRAAVHVRASGGFTALLFAAQGGKLEAARLLVGAGAEVDQASDDGVTPLIVAAMNGHQELTIFLLEQRGNPNLADFKGFTSLHYAARRRTMLDAISALLAHGANPNARSVKHGGAEELTALRDIPFLKAPARIVKAGTKGGTFPVGATPFYLAAQQRNAKGMRLLAEGGADPNLGTTETVYLLGESGRRVNYIAGTTPLMAAAGADTVITNWNDYTREQEAQALEAVRTAIDVGADVNAANEYGITALHAAAFIGSEPLIQLLVRNGSRLDTFDQYGQTPLSIARHVITTKLGDNFDVRPRRHRADVADLLVALGATPLDESGVDVLMELK